MNKFLFKVRLAPNSEPNFEDIKVVRLSNFITFFALLTLFINIFMIFSGGFKIGISSDEPTHVMRMQNYFDSGWYLTSTQLIDGVPAESASDKYVYGPLVALLGHAVNVLLGNEELGTVLSTPEAYAARHLTVGIFGILGLFVVGITSKTLFKSWRWGVLAASLLAAIPLWTGHAMFNIKDTPVATGYSLTTLGLIFLAQPNTLSVTKQRLISQFILTLGIVITLGTRPGMWPILLASIIFMLGSTLLLSSKIYELKTGFNFFLHRLALVFKSVLIAFLILLIMYPKAFSSPLSLLSQSASSSSNYELWNGWTVTAGVGHAQPPSWWYLPAWITNQLPILIIILFFIGITYWLMQSELIHAKNIRVPTNVYVLIGVSLVVVQAILAPLAAIVLQSRLYSGFRQLLFIVPAWSLLATVGVWYLAKTKNSISFLRATCAGALSFATALSLVLPTIDQIRLFPYNYAYFNELASTQTINNRWATDYWFLSSREIASLINSKEPFVCFNPLVLGRNSLTDPAIGYPLRPFQDCLRAPQIAPYLKNLSTKVSTLDLMPYGYWYVRENQFGYNIPSNCSLADEVSRPLRGQNLMLSYIARCEMIFEQYLLPETNDSTEINKKFLLDGWSILEGNSIWSIGEFARIGITLPKVLQENNLILKISGQHFTSNGKNKIVKIYVNNILMSEKVQIDIKKSKIEINILIPKSVSDDLGSGRLLIKVETLGLETPAVLDLNDSNRIMGFNLQSFSIKIVK